MQTPFPIKRNTSEVKLFYIRLITIAVCILILTGILVVRLVFLQINQHDRFTTLSEANELTLIPIEPTRGLIYDRNGVLLAENVPAFSLDIIPAKVKHLTKTISELSKLVTINQMNVKDFYKLLSQKSKFEPVPLKMELTEEEVARFVLNQWHFPGVEINARLIRHYPLGPTMAHIVGFMGRINTDELSTLDSSNYRATNMIGKTGIEKHFENELHGTVGYQQAETDANGRIVRILKRVAPIGGVNLYLTIDNDLQLAATKILGPNNGAIVAIQPATGQILALVTHPSFDPNQFAQGIDAKQYQILQKSPDKPLNNRALRGLYSPGSTIKPFYAVGGLYTGAVNPGYAIQDPGYFSYGNHTYKDWVKEGHGIVNLQKAITVSCDTYFYGLSVKLGIGRINNLLSAFGFGQRTNIEIDEELPGLVPSPLWKTQHQHSSWYMGDTIVTGIGQGYLLVTPLQLATATTVLAERGKRYQPHLLWRVQKPDNSVLQQQPIVLPFINISDKAWDLIQTGMYNVIASNAGTGYRFGRDAPYSVAAKTGTAQVFSGSRFKKFDLHDQLSLPVHLRDNSLFIAFAPVENPTITIAVVAEHSKEAAVFARQFLDYYFLQYHDKSKQQS